MRNLLRFALLVVAVGAIALLVAGPGTRLGAWDLRSGFMLLRWAAYAGVAGTVLTIVVLFAARPRGMLLAVVLAALVAGAVTFAVPWEFRQRAQRLPAIHDITTDFDNPPQFVAVLPLRAGAPNSAEYAGREVAAQQRAAYPDIAPRTLDVGAAACYERALNAARASGWEIVAADPLAGRIEATDTTFWFGFKDDVVVRLQPHGNQCRVDVRSLSRLGRSDVGKNAARVRAYLGRL
jgi:uncharacterized protein (DUF1499 family)